MFTSDTDSQASSGNSRSRANLSDYTGSRPKFKFPPKPRLSKSVNNSLSSTQSDSSSAQSFRSVKKRNRKKLPPLGIFWDIENCQVPKNRSASAVVQRIRGFFLQKYREAEFLVVCDVKKERQQIIQELHDAQINLIHVASTSKNAADEKLRQCLRRFAEVHKAPSGVVLISGDINFAADLSDLRYRKKIHVILVHNSNVADALILCANEHYCFTAITEDLPEQRVKALSKESAYLRISNLPLNFNGTTIKNRLNFLTNNCGGRVTEVLTEEGVAYIRFSSQDAANRAQKRVQGEDVFGNKIKAVTPSLRNYAGHKVKGGDASFQSHQFQSGRNLQDASTLKETRGHQQDLLGQDVGFSSMDERHGAVPRRPRTQQNSFRGRVHRTSASSEYSDDGKVQNGSGRDSIKMGQPVNLIISNLDSNLNSKDLRKILTDMVKEYAMILCFNIVMQSDGSQVAKIKVNSQQAAQFVISQLHRQKLGSKRLAVSYAQTNSPNSNHLKAMVISTLQEVPDNQMPLFKFIELLESRYHCTVSVSDVYKLNDICQISENLGSRIISFTPGFKSSPTPNLSEIVLPYCTIHCVNGLPNVGWCSLNIVQTTNLMVPLKKFSEKLNQLLDLHMGNMPLLSFQACYEQECHEELPVDPNGVPLEHLITCVPDVEINFSGPNKNIKIITRKTKNTEVDEDAFLKTIPPTLASNISLLCRELVDLLKTTDKCQMLLSKFVPSYHHHFGRQCVVAGYGYTKLIDLFESISHVVQIMGDGTRKIITLSHQAQMRRFTSDLIRVLKLQPGKQITLNDFPAAFEKVMNKAFNPVDFGLCTFQDLLEEVPENMIVFTQNADGELVIAIPKREQTAKEIIKTKQFAMEVIDILKHSPYCTMMFNKFVPAYHHHFGHQCRVSDYGFSKLIELFEAIPDVVRIKQLQDGERTVSLTHKHSLKILGTQIVGLLKNSARSTILLGELSSIFVQEYGFPLEPQMYECDSILELVEKIPDYVQVIKANAGSFLVCVDAEKMSTLKVQIWALLLQPPYCKDLATFQYEFHCQYNTSISKFDLKQLRNVVSLSCKNDTNYIALTDSYILAAQLYYIIATEGGSILYNNLERLYMQAFGKNLRLADYNINNVDELYEQFDFLFFTCEYNKGVLTLNRKLAEYQLPPAANINNSNQAFNNKKWPAPPALHKLVQQANAAKTMTPKSETEEYPSSILNGITPSKPRRSSIWDSPVLSLNLPISLNPQLLGDPYDLISPAKQLFSVNKTLWDEGPDPEQLPMPDSLVNKSTTDNSHDSGINSKLECSDNEKDASGANRHFPSPFKFS